MHTRVTMGNTKWPELHVRDQQGQWAKISDAQFDEAKAVYNQRQREISDKKAPKRPPTVPMEVGDKETPVAGPSKNPRLPSQSTPAATRGKSAK